MPNFTNLPERHFVDKAKRLSLGDKDSDVYFDGEALEALINTVEDLQEQIEHLPTEAFTTMTITHNEGTAFRVTADYAELVKAIRERSPILAKVYDRSIPSAVTSYSLSSSTAEDLEEFVIAGQEIVMGSNVVIINRVEVSFPPTTGTPNYSVSITSKQIPTRSDGTFTLRSIGSTTNAWTYTRVGNLVFCKGSLASFDQGGDQVFTAAWDGLPFRVGETHSVVVANDNYLITLELNNTGVSVTNCINLLTLQRVDATTAARAGIIEFSYITNA